MWVSLYTDFFFFFSNKCYSGISGGSVVKNLLANAGDTGDVALISQLGRSAGVGNGKPYSIFLPGKSHGQRSLGVA